jgi:tetratricopeptide (TPR) repeat protein
MNRNGNGNQIPVEAQYLYRKAVECAEKGNHETALNYLRQVVMIAPRFSKAFNEMGNCLCRMGREREAFAKYEKALTIDPGLTEAFQSRNSILDKLNEQKR